MFKIYTADSSSLFHDYTVVFWYLKMSFQELGKNLKLRPTFTHVWEDNQISQKYSKFDIQGALNSQYQPKFDP